jgi:hypothetical protein
VTAFTTLERGMRATVIGGGLAHAVDIIGEAFSVTIRITAAGDARNASPANAGSGRSAPPRTQPDQRKSVSISLVSQSVGASETMRSTRCPQNSGTLTYARPGLLVSTAHPSSQPVSATFRFLAASSLGGA